MKVLSAASELFPLVKTGGLADVTGALGYAPSKFTNSSSAPGSPSDGDRWFDPDTGILYVYINDGTSSQWVEL